MVLLLTAYFIDMTALPFYFSPFFLGCADFYDCFVKANNNESRHGRSYRQASATLQAEVAASRWFNWRLNQAAEQTATKTERTATNKETEGSRIMCSSKPPIRALHCADFYNWVPNTYTRSTNYEAMIEGACFCCLFF